MDAWVNYESSNIQINIKVKTKYPQYKPPKAAYHYITIQREQKHRSHEELFTWLNSWGNISNQTPGTYNVYLLDLNIEEFIFVGG